VVRGRIVTAALLLASPAVGIAAYLLLHVH
jgi:hypothetical protein